MSKTSDDVADTPTESEKGSSATREVLQQTESPGSEDERKVMSDLSMVDSRGEETTEDEMDDDAVLLKRPKGE